MTNTGMTQRRRKERIQAKVNQQLQTREDEFKQQLKELVNKANIFYFNIEVILVDGMSDKMKKKREKKRANLYIHQKLRGK